MIRKILLRCMKKDWHLYSLLAILIILIVITGLVPARALEKLINDYFLANDKQYSTLYYLIILFCGSMVLIGVFEFCKRLLLLNLGETFTKEIRTAMALKMKTIDYHYYIENDTGVIVSYFTNDVNAINAIFTDGVISMIVDLLQIIAITIQMFIYSYLLGILTLIIIPLIFIISNTFKKKMFQSQKQNRKIVSKVNNHIVETIKNIPIVKVYNATKYMEQNYDELLCENYNVSNKVSFYDSFYSPLIQFTTAFIICLVVILSNEEMGLMAVNVGVIAGSIEYITALFLPIEKLGMELQTVQKASSGLSRVNEFFKVKDENPKLDASIIADFRKQKLKITFENVNFAYEKENYVIKDFNLSINENERITLAGRTGVGKTTIFNLILGNLIPTSGHIYLNGIDACLIPNEIKYLIFGYVSQSFKPIKGTIKENITLKAADISEEMVTEALEIVGLDTKITDLDKEYSNEDFSQGEKQLLNIARAIAPNPLILLLDEMTSSLDTLTEEFVLKAIKKASLNRTIISISHRLTKNIDTERIITIEEGKITKSYTKDEYFKSHELKVTVGKDD